MGDIYPTVLPGVVAGAARVVTPGSERARVEHRGRSQGMDGIRELLEAVRTRGLLAGHFRALLHIAIGRRVTRPDGTVLSTGLTWRELSALLKQLRFDKELVREFGSDPEALAPRDRQRFWYSAIALAKVDSAEAVAEAGKLVDRLKELGFVVGPAPVVAAPPVPPSAAATKGKAKKEDKPKVEKKDEKPAKRKKKS